MCDKIIAMLEAEHASMMSIRTTNNTFADLTSFSDVIEMIEDCKYE